MEIKNIMEASPLAIEAVLYRGRACRCVVCKQPIKHDDPAIHMAVGVNPNRRWWIHAGGCAMGVLMKLMKEWNNINNGGGPHGKKAD